MAKIQINTIQPGPDNPHNTPILDPSGISRKYLDLNYTPDNPHPMRKLDIYLPEEGEGPFPVLIHMHGGGFVGGLKNDFHAINYMTEALEANLAFVSVEQRLCSRFPDGSFDPDGAFPGSLFDLKAAIRFLRVNAAAYLLDTARFALIGPSAGGYHVAMAAATQDVPVMYDESFGHKGVSEKVHAVIDMFGVSDLVTQQAFAHTKLGQPAPGVMNNHDAFFGAMIMENQHLARFADPIRWITPDMPPILIQAGEADQVVTVECSRKLARRVEEVCGKDRVVYNEFPDYAHGDPRFHDPANKKHVFGWLLEKLNVR